MIKLSSLLREIKLVGKITPEMVEKLWDEKIGNVEGREAAKIRYSLRQKYFCLKNLQYLSQNQLESFYRDLFNLKNS